MSIIQNKINSQTVKIDHENAGICLYPDIMDKSKVLEIIDSSISPSIDIIKNSMRLANQANLIQSNRIKDTLNSQNSKISNIQFKNETDNHIINDRIDKLVDTTVTKNNFDNTNDDIRSQINKLKKKINIFYFVFCALFILFICVLFIMGISLK